MEWWSIGVLGRLKEGNRYKDQIVALFNSLSIIPMFHDFQIGMERRRNGWHFCISWTSTGKIRDITYEMLGWERRYPLSKGNPDGFFSWVRVSNSFGEEFGHKAPKVLVIEDDQLENSISMLSKSSFFSDIEISALSYTDWTYCFWMTWHRNLSVEMDLPMVTIVSAFLSRPNDWKELDPSTEER